MVVNMDVTGSIIIKLLEYNTNSREIILKEHITEWCNENNMRATLHTMALAERRKYNILYCMTFDSNEEKAFFQMKWL